MKKISFFVLFLFAFSSACHAQIMVSKLISKGDAKYGLGYGLSAYFNYPFNENQSVRLELLEIAAFPTKGENLFTTTEDAKGYLSIKLGYKYTFSESQQGFYVLPSAGYCRVVFAKQGEDATYGDGIAAALEGGYTWVIGQRGSNVNLGLKYEFDHGNATHIIQSVGFRAYYGFGLGRRRD